MEPEFYTNEYLADTGIAGSAVFTVGGFTFTVFGCKCIEDEDDEVAFANGRAWVTKTITFGLDNCQLHASLLSGGYSTEDNIVTIPWTTVEDCFYDEFYNAMCVD